MKKLGLPKQIVYYFFAIFLIVIVIEVILISQDGQSLPSVFSRLTGNGAKELEVPDAYKSVVNEAKFESLADNDGINIIEENVFFAELQSVNNDEVRFVRQGRDMTLIAADEYFSYVCTTQELSGEEYYSRDKVSEAVFVNPTELNNILDKGDPILLVYSKLDDSVVNIVGSNKCP